MKTALVRLPARILALWISLALAPPSPAHALRPEPASENKTGLEELRDALSVSAGSEEESSEVWQQMLQNLLKIETGADLRKFRERFWLSLDGMKGLLAKHGFQTTGASISRYERGKVPVPEELKKLLPKIYREHASEFLKKTRLRIGLSETAMGAALGKAGFEDGEGVAGTVIRAWEAGASPVSPELYDFLPAVYDEHAWPYVLRTLSVLKMTRERFARFLGISRVALFKMKGHPSLETMDQLNALRILRFKEERQRLSLYQEGIVHRLRELGFRSSPLDPEEVRSWEEGKAVIPDRAFELLMAPPSAPASQPSSPSRRSGQGQQLERIRNLFEWTNAEMTRALAGMGYNNGKPIGLATFIRYKANAVPIPIQLLEILPALYSRWAPAHLISTRERLGLSPQRLAAALTNAGYAGPVDQDLIGQWESGTVPVPEQILDSFPAVYLEYAPRRLTLGRMQLGLTLEELGEELAKEGYKGGIPVPRSTLSNYEGGSKDHLVPPALLDYLSLLLLQLGAEVEDLTTAGMEEARERAGSFLRALAADAPQPLTPVVIGAGLEQAHPELGVFRQVKGLPVLFAGEMTPAEVAVELITRFDAHGAVFAGTEEEAGRFLPILSAAGISAVLVNSGHLILSILAKAAGMEEAALAARDGIGRFLDDLAALSPQA